MASAKPLMKGSKANVLEAIGNTPIVKLSNLTKDIESEIYVKLEFMNPGGSIKDRIGVYMLDQAVKNGDLKPGGTIIEGTSGNTGVGLAMWAAIHGYKCIFVLADKQSKEKIDNLRAFGAKVVVCPTNVEPEDPRSYYSVSKRLSETIPNSFYVNQYDNLHNRDTHYYETGPEILEQTQGDFDVFLATVGTGGTITGVGQYLKDKMKDKVRVVGVDCEGSIIAEYAQTGKMGEPQTYVLEGVGEDFIPENYVFEAIDDWEIVGDKESFLMTRRLLKEEGIYAGGSSGAAIVGALRYAKKLKEPKRILVVLHDSGNRYASKIYNDDWMSDNGYLDSSFDVQITYVLDALGKKRNLITIDDKSTIGDAIHTMEEKGISQLPVIGEGELKGLVAERQLFKPVMMGEFSREDNISLAFHGRYKVVDQNELLSNVADALLQKEVAIVKDGDKFIDILTEIDVLQYLSENRNV